MSQQFKVVEPMKEIKPNIFADTQWDSSKSRLVLTLANHKAVPVEARVHWTNLTNLEVAPEFFEQGGEGCDNFGRVLIPPSQSRVCGLLTPANPQLGTAFGYKVFESEAIAPLPPVSRVIERTEIRTGVVVVANWYGPLRQMHLVVQNKRSSNIRLKLVWTAFDNMRILRGGSGDIFIAANKEEVYAIMTPRDRDRGWKYRYSFRMIENATEPVFGTEIARDHASNMQALDSFKELSGIVLSHYLEQQSNRSDISGTDPISPASFSSSSSASSSSSTGTSKDVDPELIWPELDRLCASRKVLFVDLDFPPKPSSIFSELAASKRRAALGPTTPNAALLPPQLRDITWKRASELHGTEHCTLLAQGSIEPRIIRAGAAEQSSWLAATLAALAEKPEVIDMCFLTKTINPRCRYSLRLFIGGECKTINIDDYVPCYPLAGPAFTRSHGNELWPLLLTKGLAKANGGYSDLLNGSPHEAMITLTGCPVETVPIRHKGKAVADMWRKLSEWTRQGFIMVALTDKVDEGKTGLLQRHYYTVVGTVPTRKPTDPQLIMLRSPLEPSRIWTGAWGLKGSGSTTGLSQEWNDPNHAGMRAIPVVANVLDRAISAQDNGEFFMSLADFCTHFRVATVCCFRKDWNVLRVPSQFNLNHALKPSFVPSSFAPSATTTTSSSSSSAVHDDGNKNTPLTALVNPCDLLHRYATGYYMVQIEEKTMLVASLHQQETTYKQAPGHSLPRHGFMSSGIVICKAEPIGGNNNNNNNNNININNSGHGPDGQGNEVVRYEPGDIIADSSCLLAKCNSVECYRIEPGAYFIIPYALGPLSTSVPPGSSTAAASTTTTSSSSSSSSSSTDPNSNSSAIDYATVDPVDAPSIFPYVLVLHAATPIRIQPFPAPSLSGIYATQRSLLTRVMVKSIAQHGVTVACNVPGLKLYDWCAKKSAFFACEMTQHFFDATGKRDITFKHELTETDNLYPICGKQVEVPLSPGMVLFINAAIVTQTQKAWKYKHRWEFVYADKPIASVEEEEEEDGSGDSGDEDSLTSTTTNSTTLSSTSSSNAYSRPPQ